MWEVNTLMHDWMWEVNANNTLKHDHYRGCTYPILAEISSETDANKSDTGAVLAIQFTMYRYIR